MNILEIDNHCGRSGCGHLRNFSKRQAIGQFREAGHPLSKMLGVKDLCKRALSRQFQIFKQCEVRSTGQDVAVSTAQQQAAETRFAKRFNAINNSLP